MYHRQPYSDAELIQQLRQGSEDAFTEIYNRYWEILFSIAYKFSKDKELACEIVQDVFMGLWNRRSEKIINHLSAYLATAARFEVFKQIAREKRREQILQNGPAPILALEGDETINAVFLKEFIHGEIEKLPEKCRLVFRFSREQGMTIPEIAQQLHVSNKAVEGHLTKALKILRRSLKDAYGWLFTLL
jgi:RNA polymerase sigma-70 factor (ECF subfamily)